MDTKIKDLMIPISEYVSVGMEDTLYDCFKALEEDKAAKAMGHSHRDVLVFDAEGDVQGKVTMIDIYLALEPGYKSLMDSMDEGSVLTPEYMAGMFRDYDLWTQPLSDLCSKAARLKVKDIMHEPHESEFVEAGDRLDKALNMYVLGVHQPLLVREGGKIVGALRFGDVFSKIKESVLACEL